MFTRVRIAIEDTFASARARLVVALVIVAVLVAVTIAVLGGSGPAAPVRDVSPTTLRNDVAVALRYSASPTTLPSAAAYQASLTAHGISDVALRDGRLTALVKGSTQCVVLPQYVGEPVAPCSGSTLVNPRSVLAKLHDATDTELENLGQKLVEPVSVGSLYLAIAPGDVANSPHLLAYGLGNPSDVFATSGSRVAALYCFTYPQLTEIDCSPLGGLVASTVSLFTTHELANAAALTVNAAYQHARSGAAELAALRTYETLPLRQLASWSARQSSLPNVIRFTLAQREGTQKTIVTSVVCVLNAHYVNGTPTGAGVVPPSLMGASLVGFFGNGPC
jgi:hypothetical protein